jgi:hypothetical protein
MKFRVTMKDPDTLWDAIREAVNADLEMMVPELDADEKDAIRDVRVEKVAGLCGRWFKHSEYLTVEIDTDAKTCVVVQDK